MRLTTDEILEKRPYMNLSGKSYDTVQGRYYGDLPDSILSTEYRFPDDETLCNLEAADVFIARCYAPETVEKYSFKNGGGYRIKDGRIIAGDINIKYGGGYSYTLMLFNGHCGSDGFTITKPDTGRLTYVHYSTPGYDNNPWNPIYKRATINDETIEKLFRKVETRDEYGEFARLLVQVAREMMARKMPV